MKKILICGDSFAADWHQNVKGGPNLLSEIHRVDNLAQAGCSQYKIYKQIISANLGTYDRIIICHTSPFRIYCEKHPVHHSSLLHSNCDFIYSDVVENVSKDYDLKVVKKYFELYFSQDYAIFTHNLICKEITSILANYSVIHITFFDYKNLFEFDRFHSFYDVFLNYKGSVNHLNEKGNLMVFESLNKQLEI